MISTGIGDMYINAAKKHAAPKIEIGLEIEMRPTATHPYHPSRHPLSNFLIRGPGQQVPQQKFSGIGWLRSLPSSANKLYKPPRTLTLPSQHLRDKQVRCLR